MADTIDSRRRTPGAARQSGAAAGALALYITLLLTVLVAIIAVLMKLAQGAGESIASVRFPEIPGLTSPQGRSTAKVLQPAPGSRDGIAVGNLSIEISAKVLRISNKKGGQVLALQAPVDRDTQLHALILDPYRPLVMKDGWPFLDIGKVRHALSDNIRTIAEQNGEFKALPIEEFRTFPFFKPEPTTIGFLSADLSKTRDRLTLYFIDTETGAMVTAVPAETAFPEFLRGSIYPPPIVARRQVALGVAGAPVMPLIDGVWGVSDGRYVSDPQIRSAVINDEFKRALLTRDELELLRRSDLTKVMTGSTGQSALQKLVMLLWYGKMTGRGESLTGLVGTLHPTIAKVINANPALAPGKT